MQSSNSFLNKLFAPNNRPVTVHVRPAVFERVLRMLTSPGRPWSPSFAYFDQDLRVRLRNLHVARMQILTRAQARELLVRNGIEPNPGPRVSRALFCQLVGAVEDSVRAGKLSPSAVALPPNLRRAVVAVCSRLGRRCPSRAEITQRLIAAGVEPNPGPKGKKVKRPAPGPVRKEDKRETAAVTAAKVLEARGVDSRTAEAAAGMGFTVADLTALDKGTVAPSIQKAAAVVAVSEALASVGPVKTVPGAKKRSEKWAPNPGDAASSCSPPLLTNLTPVELSVPAGGPKAEARLESETASSPAAPTAPASAAPSAPPMPQPAQVVPAETGSKTGTQGQAVGSKPPDERPSGPGKQPPPGPPCPPPPPPPPPDADLPTPVRARFVREGSVAVDLARPGQPRDGIALPKRALERALNPGYATLATELESGDATLRREAKTRLAPYVTVHTTSEIYRNDFDADYRAASFTHIKADSRPVTIDFVRLVKKAREKQTVSWLRPLVSSALGVVYLLVGLALQQLFAMELPEWFLWKAHPGTALSLFSTVPRPWSHFTLQQLYPTVCNVLVWTTHVGVLFMMGATVWLVDHRRFLYEVVSEGTERVHAVCPTLLSSLIVELRTEEALQMSGGVTILRLMAALAIPAHLAPAVSEGTLWAAKLVFQNKRCFQPRASLAGGRHGL